MPHEKCCAIIEEGRGTHLDPIVVDGFLTIKEEFLRLREILS